MVIRTSSDNGKHVNKEFMNFNAKADVLFRKHQFRKYKGSIAFFMNVILCLIFVVAAIVVAI